MERLIAALNGPSLGRERSGRTQAKKAVVELIHFSNSGNSWTGQLEVAVQWAQSHLNRRVSGDEWYSGKSNPAADMAPVTACWKSAAQRPSCSRMKCTVRSYFSASSRMKGA
jgi:hypothetical protein